MLQWRTRSEKPALSIPVVFRSLSSDANTAEVHSAALQNCVIGLKSKVEEKAMVVVLKYKIFF